MPKDIWEIRGEKQKMRLGKKETKRLQGEYYGMWSDYLKNKILNISTKSREFI